MGNYTIISREGFLCSWCEKAKDILNSKGMSYDIQYLSKVDLLKEAARAKMASIPIIYHGDKLVGGFSELKKYLA